MKKSFIKFKTIVAIILIQVAFMVLFSSATHAAEPKRIEVNLSTQRIKAIEGSTIIHDFPISSGKTITPTPTGTFYPWIKLRYTRMEGGNRRLGTYYNLPKVPYVIYFANESIQKFRGYGIHGTYWHNNFGTPMSHGCINVATPNMALLYNWIELPSPTSSGTPITIIGTTPSS